MALNFSEIFWCWFVETTSKVCNDCESKRETFFQKSLSTYFERVPKLHKGLLKERLLLASKRGELPKVQTQISTKHFYPFLRFELRARQNLHKCALLKAIMNYESHFHRRTHTSDWYSSLCRARSYIEIKSLMKLFICVLWKRQIDTQWKDKKCTREVFFERAFRKKYRNVWLNG